MRLRHLGTIATIDENIVDVLVGFTKIISLKNNPNNSRAAAAAAAAAGAQVPITRSTVPLARKTLVASYIFIFSTYCTKQVLLKAAPSSAGGVLNLASIFFASVCSRGRAAPPAD